MVIRGCGGRRRKELKEGGSSPRKTKKNQPGLDYILCFTFSPVRAGFEGCSLKH